MYTAFKHNFDMRKVVIIGNSDVGKTSIMKFFIYGKFTVDSGPTIGVDYASKSMEVDGKKVKLSIWDTAGQERFRSLVGAYYRGASAAVIVYDVNNRITFTAVNKYIEDVRTLAGSTTAIILVGNKIDVGEEAREVNESEGHNYAADHNLVFLETSAKTGANVNEVFTSVVRTSMHHTPLPQYTVYSATTESVELGQPRTLTERRLPQCQCT